MANFVPKAPTDPLFKAENISFLNRKGDVVASTYNAAGKSWAIELPAGTAGEDELFAYFRGSTSVSVGKLSINRFIEQPKKLQIVLLRGAAALDNADLQTQLNKIYAPALLKWQVVQQSLNCDFDLNADGKAGLDVGDKDIRCQDLSLNTHTHTNRAGSFTVFGLRSYSSRNLNLRMPMTILWNDSCRNESHRPRWLFSGTDECNSSLQ